MKFTRKTAKFLSRISFWAYILSNLIDMLITKMITGQVDISCYRMHLIFWFVMMLGFILEKYLPLSLSDEEVQKKYVEAGKSMGDALSYIYMGRCGGFEEMLENWAYWEREYAVRGYKTLPVDDFIEYARGGSLEGLNIKRQADEEPIFHAEIVKKILPIYEAQVTIDSVGEGGALSGTYVLPSTKE